MIEKYGITDQKELLEAELLELTARLGGLDKTASAGEISRMADRKVEVERALTELAK